MKHPPCANVYARAILECACDVIQFICRSRASSYSRDHTYYDFVSHTTSTNDSQRYHNLSMQTIGAVQVIKNCTWDLLFKKKTSLLLT